MHAINLKGNNWRGNDNAARVRQIFPDKLIAVRQCAGVRTYGVVGVRALSVIKIGS